MELTTAPASNDAAIAEPRAPTSASVHAAELPEPPVRSAESAARSSASAPPPASSATTEPAVEAAPEPSWAELARAGQYKQALARAEADGLDTILESATATELTLLADVARLAGDGAKATQILSTQRRRFKGDAQAAAAAFMLGRAAFDQQKAYASAAKWFATYLEEQPQGPFAREALGRLAEARQRAGDKAGARTAARAYLSAYPEGPHADVARSILAK
jgi:TolA-binding protein